MDKRDGKVLVKRKYQTLRYYHLEKVDVIRPGLYRFA